MRTLILLLLTVFSLSLCAHTYVDSIFADAELDGDMNYTAEGYPLTYNTWTYEMKVGDSGIGATIPPHASLRSFVSFTLPSIPAGYSITDATMRLYQLRSFSWGGGGFPEWNIAGGDTVDCIVSHINYGEELDFDDWGKGDVGNSYTLNPNVGVITAEGMSPPSSNGEVGYRYLDVTDCVQIDYILENVHTQFRIAFEIGTDYDDMHDFVSFSTAEAGVAHRLPRLFLTYWDGVSVDEEEMPSISDMQLFPQPVRDVTNVQFQLNKPDNVEIDVYDIRGRKRQETASHAMSSGQHTIPIDLRNLPSGVYLLRMQAGLYTTTKRIMHIR